MEKIAYVGNDVHQESISMSVYVDNARVPCIEKRMNNNKHEVQKFYKRLIRDYKVRACYEASGNGYVFHRWLKEIGVNCEVIAPSLIPKKNGDRIKTDKRDAEKLARYYRGGDLTPIHIPNEEEESARSLIRLREQLVDESRNSKQYILKFLQARGLTYRDGTNWTKKHREYLRRIKFTGRLEQRIFDEYLLLLEFKENSLKQLDHEICELAYGEEYKERVKRLTVLKGVKEVTAMGLITEIVDFRRFKKPRELMAYLGLVPSERSSGEKECRGGITKTGNSRVRRLMIEAAWHYRHRPSVIKSKEPGLEEACKIAQVAASRLHAKYWRLVNKGKCTSKAVTAVARELTGFVWAIMQIA